MAKFFDPGTIELPNTPQPSKTARERPQPPTTLQNPKIAGPRVWSGGDFFDNFLDAREYFGPSTKFHDPGAVKTFNRPQPPAAAKLPKIRVWRNVAVVGNFPQC